MMENVEPLPRLGTDVLVVGSEGAGARAAIAADDAGARVIMASKGLFGRSGVTLMAPFSCCVAFGDADPRDNPWEHFKDTIKGGHWLSNQKVVYTYTHNAPRAILDLETYGAKFNKTEDGKFEQVLMPGHTYPRAIHYHFRTGSQFKKGLTSEVRKRPNIEVKEDFFVVDVFVEGGKVRGALALDIRTGRYVVVEAGAVVFATGGAMELFYPHCDASNDLTGDGHAAALRAGAELADVEFMQFFPTGMVWPPALNGVIWIGELRYHCGGWLYNKYGERFMSKYDPARMELSTRDMTSRAIVTEILEGRGSPHGGVWLSVTHLGRNQIQAFIDETFPNFSFRGYNLLEAGVDVREDAVEIAPVAHFYMGGVRCNENCATAVPGLYVAGEVTAGVNGANRIEGNALSETQVQGRIAGTMAAQWAANAGTAKVDESQAQELTGRYRALTERTEGASQLALRTEAQEIMWKYVGVVRDGEGLEKACARLSSLREQAEGICVRAKVKEVNKELVEAIETQNLITVAEAMAVAALARKETRGSHYRRDFANEDDPQWLVNSIVSLADGQIKLRHEPVDFCYLRPDGTETPPPGSGTPF
ncbi:MAG: fumarate reductase subunit A [Thermoleophilia bacterium]